MSEKQRPRAICRKCNRAMTPTGSTFTWEPDVGVKEELKYREYVCDGCGLKMDILDWKH